MSNCFSFQKWLLPKFLVSNKSQDPTSSALGGADESIPYSRISRFFQRWAWISSQISQTDFQELPWISRERGDLRKRWFYYFLFILRLLVLKTMQSKLLMAIIPSMWWQPAWKGSQQRGEQRQKKEERDRILLKLFQRWDPGVLGTQFTLRLFLLWYKIRRGLGDVIGRGGMEGNVIEMASCS